MLHWLKEEVRTEPRRKTIFLGVPDCEYERIREWNYKEKAQGNFVAPTVSSEFQNYELALFLSTDTDHLHCDVRFYSYSLGSIVIYDVILEFRGFIKAGFQNQHTTMQLTIHFLRYQ